MDTVPLAVGCKPVRKGRRLIPAGQTALGGDDRSGSAAILTALIELLEQKLPHPPLTFLWTVQEEVGLIGARYVNQSKLGKPAMAFNFDGPNQAGLGIGATGAFRMTIRIRGVASHAGVHPEQGVSATAIASLAIADLTKNGWHGLVDKGRVRGSSNVGVIRGGEATNVVTDEIYIRAEARAHNRGLRRRIVEAYRKAFERAARSVRNDVGLCGKVEIDVQHDYESFRLALKSPVVVEARRAVEALGHDASYKITDGGLDANWMNDHGIPTITLGCGQHNIHTINEYLDLDEYCGGCQLALGLVCG